MLKKLFLLSSRQKLILVLILLVLLLIPATLLAIKKRTEFRGRAEGGEDPRTLVPATVYIPYFPLGKAEKVAENELDTNWRNTLEVFNLSGQNNQVDIAFFNERGEQEATMSASLASHASQTINLPVSPKCAGEGCVYSAVINSSKGVATVANLVRESANQYSVTSFKGLHDQEVEPVSNFPAIVREQGFNQEDKLETELIFFNPHESDVNLNAAIFNSEGAWNIPVATLSATLKARSAKRINTKSLGLPFPFKGSAVINQERPLASLALIQSDKRLYSYTPAPYSNSLFIPSVNNKILYYLFGFKKTIVVQSHAPGRQEVSLKYFEDSSTSSEIKFEVDPNLSYFLDLTGRIDDDKEVGVTLNAQYPISALVIKETPTYWGDVVLARPTDSEELFFPFIANTGSEVPTETQISMFNPHEGPLNLTFASYDQFGQSIRKRTDDEPMTIWSSESKTVTTSRYLYNPAGKDFSRGSLSVYSELEGKGFLAVIEGVRRLNDSRALLAGDAFFSYDGQRLFGEPFPTPTGEVPTPTLTGEPAPTSTIEPTAIPQKCQLNGDYNGDGVVNLVDFSDWTKDFLAGEAKLYCFEYWRRSMYSEPIPTSPSGFTPTPCPNSSCDVNNDSLGNVEDYNLIISCWRQPLNCCPRCDMNCDGALNIVDLMQFGNLCWTIIPTATIQP